MCTITYLVKEKRGVVGRVGKVWKSVSKYCRGFSQNRGLETLCQQCSNSSRVKETSYLLVLAADDSIQSLCI